MPASPASPSPAWIVFDAVGTLIEPCPAPAVVYHDVARRFGSRLSLEQVSTRFREEFARRESAADTAESEVVFQTSEDREREFWTQLITVVIDDVSDLSDCVEELLSHFARPAAWKCFDDVAVALEQLQVAGYRLAIASNFDARLHAVCDSLPELLPIECRVISSEVGFRKPSPQFYSALLAATGETDPESILMIGDDPRNDIDGAIAVGIPAILLNRRGPEIAGAMRDLHDLLRVLLK